MQNVVKSMQKKLLAWSKQVIDRDQCCQFCLTEKDLHAHHVHPQKEYPELIFVMENCLTLCRGCHTQYHNFGNTYWLGLRHKPATLKKISEAQKGKIISEEHRKKLREFNLGKKKSKEARQNMSEGQKGRIQSEETKRKISEARKGKSLSEEHKQKVSIGVKAYFARKRKNAN